MNRRRVILVHGAGGSPLTWALVAPLLEAPGRDVVLVDHPSRSHAENIAIVRAVLDESPEDAVLVGHSYGGAVITDAGRHARVRALVYVAAFAPDEGESIDDIIARHGPAEVFRGGSDPAALRMPGAADDDWASHSWVVPPRIRDVAGAHRRPISEEIYTTASGRPAWATRPSWYVLATRDRHLRPVAQRAMALRAGATLTEVRSSHSVPHAAPELVATVVETALAEAGD